MRPFWRRPPQSFFRILTVMRTPKRYLLTELERPVENDPLCINLKCNVNGCEEKLKLFDAIKKRNIHKDVKFIVSRKKMWNVSVQFFQVFRIKTYFVTGLDTCHCGYEYKKCLCVLFSIFLSINLNLTLI